MTMVDEPAPVAALAEFSGSAQQEGATKKSYKYQYWRKPNGELCVGPSWAIEAESRLEEGWESLRAKYGVFGLSEVKMNDDGEIIFRWSSAQAPWRFLFERHGEKEFSLAQIVESNWHRSPPYPGVRFPQLAGVEVIDVACSVCLRKFSSLEKRQAEAMLARHESVAHKDASSNNALSRSLAEALKPGASQDALTQALVSLASTQEAILKLLSKPAAPAGKAG